MRAELQRMRDLAQQRQYHGDLEIDDCFDELHAKYIEDKCSDFSELRRETEFFKAVCKRQQAIINPGERIVFTRMVDNIKPWHKVSNICADWDLILHEGLDGRIAVAKETLGRCAGDAAKVEFLDCAIECLQTVSELIERHADKAITGGNEQLEELLRRVAHRKPETFHEALQLHNFIRESLWLQGHCHIGLGRFDQYMMPFLEGDLAAGRITQEDAEDLVTEYFIATNRNSQFYFGMQQGDNGQSMMLGGMRPEGTCGVNELTYMCLRVSEKLNLIDPKINLRVDSQTDDELLKLASKLTRRGLGFPQYNNDDVVIPALVEHGYELKDARNYTVAACWEFTIAGKGLEVPNIEAASFPYAADRAIWQGLAEGESFDAILEHVKKGIKKQVDTFVNERKGYNYRKAPLYSAFMSGCLESGLEVEDCAKYKNYGIHGAGSANAVDALAAVKKFVFDDKIISGEDYLKALENDWQGYEPMRQMVINDKEKVGNDSAQANAMLRFLFDSFADACESHKDNGRGGIVRPGTGSAMYYVFLSDKSKSRFAVDATADGRRKGDYFSSSLAPSPGTRVEGPTSILQSYSVIDYSRVCNGGPITMELSDTVFSNESGLEKVAMLIKTFVKLGCQQLQLNTLNAETLKNAMERPELHRNLVVRVWGWSGYFCELEKPYQEHIIKRNVLQMS